MLLKVHFLPDPILKKRARPVRPDDRGLNQLIADMWQTLDHHPRCVGLAAPQVGHSLQLIVVDAARVDRPGSRNGRLALLNPEITARRKPRLLREGCLSVPDYTGNVLRDDEVEVRALTPEGEPVVIAAHGFEAVVFQHEVDHLEGKLFLDRVGSLESDVFRRKNYG
jgi:peptide deformylase